MEFNKESFNQIYVSYFKSFTGKESCEMAVSRVLNGIRSDYFKSAVENVRLYRESNPDLSKQYKSSLHAVTFCGLFPNERKQGSCTQYNNLLVIDIDHLESDKFYEVYDSLMQDPYVAAFWESPSGRGYKGLIHLNYKENTLDFDVKTRHKIAFRQIYIYLLSTYGIDLDRSGSDISRLCFMSWDPNIVIKDRSKAFEVDDNPMPDKSVGVSSNEKSSDKKKSSEYETKLKVLDWKHVYGLSGFPQNSEYRFKLANIYKKLSKRGISITDTYENWVKVAFAIASTIHPTKGKELFLNLCRLDGIKHDEAKSERLIFDAYSRNTRKVNFGTIIYLARQKGLSNI